MGEYKIKIRDTLQEGRYVKEQENQPPLLQTREELIDFLIRNNAYPYCSKTGKIFFRRLKKAEDENTDFEVIIKNGAVEKLGLQTEEDCRFLRERFNEEPIETEKGSQKLMEHYFPGDEYRDIPGLCKVASIEEIIDQGYSLNPGRYVGVAEKEEEDFDFNERLHELNEELERLNIGAHELEEKIAENVVKILEGV